MRKSTVAYRLTRDGIKSKKTGRVRGGETGNGSVAIFRLSLNRNRIARCANLGVH